MDITGLRKKAGSIGTLLKGWDNIAVIYHYDADGICSGAIICKALERAGKNYKAQWVKQLYKETIEEIKGLGDKYVFVDFGSGQLEQLVQEFGENFVVIDHHQKSAERDFKREVNPFDFGVDGGLDVSGSGLSYLVSLGIGKNEDLAALAIVGALGDMQDSKGCLKGVNEGILESAISQGLVKVEKDLALYGRISRPLIQYIMFASSPVIPGLTANEEKCVSFLMELGIELKFGEEWRSYSDLNETEKRVLINALVMHMNKEGVPEWKILSMFGDVYSLLKEDNKSPLRDGKEYATLCNSCGRHGMAEVALAVCMGDRNEKYEEARGLLSEHRRQLRRGIEFVQENGVEDRGSYYFFDSGVEIKESIVGIVAGMLYGSGQLEGEKPIIAIAESEDGGLKISGRGTGGLIRRGLNIGGALKEICAELGEGAEGGGHCLIGDTIIFDEKKGFIEIKELSANRILSHNENNLVFEKINDKFTKDVSQTYYLKTKTFAIRCSKDHRFFVFEDGGIKEKKALELKPKDFMLGINEININYSCQKLEVDPYIYLKPEGIEVLKEAREKSQLSYLDIKNKDLNLVRHKLYDLEKRYSHRLKKSELVSLLKCLGIPEKKITKKMINREFISKISEVTPDLSRLIGYLVGNGYIDKNRLEFKELDRVLVNKFSEIVGNNFNPTIKTINRGSHFVVRAFSSDFCTVLKKNFPELSLKAKFVKIPKKIIFSGKKQNADFIGGLFDAEGCVTLHSIKIAMSSKRILAETQLLLLNYGVESSLREKISVPGMFDLEINDFNSLERFSNKIKFTKNSKKDIKLKKLIKELSMKKRNSNMYLPISMGDLIKFLRNQQIPTKLFNFDLIRRAGYKKISKYLFDEKILPTIRAFNKKNKSKAISEWIELVNPKNLKWCEIKKIDIENKKTKMFDLSIPTTENYMANGLIVHNSIAAGCKIKKEQRERFLELLGKVFEGQIRKN